jgi:hypothetical protein
MDSNKNRDYRYITLADKVSGLVQVIQILQQVVFYV